MNIPLTLKLSTKVVSTIVPILALLAASPAAAALLDDFKQASTKKGCESIPYADERRNCTAHSEQVEENCKRNVVQCDKLYGQKERLRSKLDNVEKEMKKKEDDRRKIEDKLNKTKVEGEKKKYDKEMMTIDLELKDKREMVNNHRSELGAFDTEHDIAAGLQRAKWCVTARQAVDQVFDLNSDRVLQQSLDSKATDKERTELKSYVSTIIGKMKTEWKTHSDAISDSQRRVANCQKVIDLNR